MPGELDLQWLAAGHVEDAQNDQDARRDDGADHAAPLRERRRRLDAAQRRERRCPVDNQHEHDGIHIVGRERLVPLLVGSDERERHGGKRECGRKPDRRLQPQQEDRHEPPARAEGLADPAEHATLLWPRRGKFSCHDGHRDQEEDRGKKVVEDRGQPVGGLGGQPAQAHHGGDVHDGQRPNPQGGCAHDRILDL